MITPASIGWIFKVVFGSKKWTSVYRKVRPSNLWLEQLSRRSNMRWLWCFKPTWRSNSWIHSWNSDVIIQALALLRYVMGIDWIFIFLKQHGFSNFLMIKGFNLWELSAFAHNAIKRRSLFTLRLARRLIANVQSGSNLKKYQYCTRAR
jgi:hypothetical protein